METVTTREESSVYTTLHEQFKNYKIYFKSRDNPTYEDGISSVMELGNKCKEIIEKMQETLNKKLENVESNDAEFPRLMALKCAIMYEKGRTFQHFYQEELGLEAMEEAMTLSTPHQHLPEISYLILKMCNSTSFLQSQLEKYDKSYNTLEVARTVYRQITDGNFVNLYTIEDLFSEDSVITPKAETKILLERLMTNNLQILSFVCNRLDCIDDFLKYTHEVLERELLDTENNPTLWATKASRLALGFMNQNRFREARNHLAAAYSILNNYGEQLQNHGEDEKMETKYEKLKHTQADVAKLWVKYCEYLLHASKKKLLSPFYAKATNIFENIWHPRNTTNEEAAGDEGTVSATEPPMVSAISEAYSNIVENETVESQNSKPDEDTSNNLEEVEELKKNEEGLKTSETEIGEGDSSQSMKDETNEIPQESLLLFASLALGDLEDQVTAELVENTEQARAVVTFAHTWLTQAESYYTIDQYPTDYVNGTLDLSDVYRCLAFFEDGLETQYMIQKSRADILETLNLALNDLRPACSSRITAELLRELAEVQLDLVSLNLRRLFSIKGTHDEGDSELSTSDVVQKMEALVDLRGRLEHFSDTFALITQP